jgi:hypothetical protein
MFFENVFEASSFFVLAMWCHRHLSSKNYGIQAPHDEDECLRHHKRGKENEELKRKENKSYEYIFYKL